MKCTVHGPFHTPGLIYTQVALETEAVIYLFTFPESQ